MTERNANTDDLAVKRLTPDQLLAVRLGNFAACERLKFFVQYPVHVRRKLLEIATYAYYKPGEEIFQEGKVDEKYVVIVRGAVKIERKVQRFMSKRDPTKYQDMPPGKDVEAAPVVVVRTCYDGD